MALSEAKKAADRRHNAKLDQIMIRPYKEEGAVIRAAAKASGQSVQAYILDAIRARMAREKTADIPQEAPPVLQKASPVQEPPAAAAETVSPPRETAPASREHTAPAVWPAAAEPIPIESRFPIERLGTEVLKLDREESGREILRLERVRAGIDLMMIFCNMTREERDEWKRRRSEAVQARQNRNDAGAAANSLK